MSVELLTAKVAELEGRLQASTKFIAWGLSHDQISHATLKRWIDEVSRVADETFKLNGCCHWEVICEAIEKMASRLAPAVAAEVKPPVDELAKVTAERDSLTAELAAQKVGNLFFLHAPAEWIEQAQECVTWIQNNVHSLETAGWNEFHKRTNALAMFIRECTLATDGEPVPCPECAKLVEYFKTEPDLAVLRNLHPPHTDAGFAIMLLANRKQFLAERGEQLARMQAARDKADNAAREASQAKPPFELPPPGTAFSATVDVDNANKRETLHFYRMPGGRIVGDLGECWRAEDFGKVNPVMVTKG